MKTVVVGAGIGGLATAIRLAVRGDDVTVVEQAPKPGGKLNELRINGFRFDAGPSLFTLPNLVEELIDLVGEDRSIFPYEKLDRSCHYFWDDGTHFIAYADRPKLLKEIQAQFKTDPKPVDQHLKKSAFLYEYTASLFMERSLHKMSSYLSMDVLKALVRVGKLQLNESMHNANRGRLEHPKLVQVFNRYATYNGSDPYRAPGVLNIIPHLEHNIGTFFPKKGMYQISQTLVHLAEKAGVKFKLNEKVHQIKVEKGKVNAVVTEKETITADRVVSNADVFPTYRHLLKDQKAPEGILARERSSSALIYYWGIDRTFDQLHLHNILFSEDYKQEFQMLFEGKEISEDPTVYINITSKCQPKDAPEGCENWFVMINVPANKGQNWEELIRAARKSIVAKINRILDVNIEDHIIAEDRLDPVTIESRTSSYMGSLYGTSSNDKMAAFLRHPNFTRSIKGLYFSGGSVHPGGGIPLCLLSAKIIDQIAHD